MYIRGQLNIEVIFDTVFDRIFSQTKPFVVVAIFPDKSTMNYGLINPVGHIAFVKLDATAMKDGKTYDHNALTPEERYREASANLEVEMADGSIYFSYTTKKFCGSYTITSSDGSTWQGQICYYTTVK